MPSISDEVVIPGSDVLNDPVVTNGNATCQRLTIEPGRTVSIMAARALIVDGSSAETSLTDSNGAAIVGEETVELDGTVRLDQSGSFNVPLLIGSGTTTLTQSGTDFVFSESPVTVAAGATMLIDSGFFWRMLADLTVEGTLGAAGTPAWFTFNGPTLTNHGTIAVESIMLGGNQVSGETQRIAGSGLWEGSELDVGGPVLLADDMAVSSTTLQNYGELNPNGHTLTFAGATLNNDGALVESGTVRLAGSALQTISGTGSTSFANLTVDNAAGASLGADISVSAVLALTAGDLTTGAFAVSVPVTGTSAGAGDAVGTVKRSGPFVPGAPYAFGNPFTSIAFGSTGATPSDVSLTLAKITPSDFNTAIARHYTIDADIGSGFDATLRLHYQPSELNGNSAGDLHGVLVWVTMGLLPSTRRRSPVSITTRRIAALWYSPLARRCWGGPTTRCPRTTRWRWK